MLFRIFWSEKAETSYLHIIEYLEKEWTEKEKVQFIERTNEVIGFIRKNPFIYQKIKKNTFRAVVTSQVSLFYQQRNRKSTYTFFGIIGKIRKS